MSGPVQRVDFFHSPQRPNGGTVYVRPDDSGNPYAHVDAASDEARPVIVVHLPAFPEETQ